MSRRIIKSSDPRRRLDSRLKCLMQRSNLLHPTRSRRCRAVDTDICRVQRKGSRVVFKGWPIDSTLARVSCADGWYRFLRRYSEFWLRTMQL